MRRVLFIGALVLAGCPAKKDDSAKPAPAQKHDIEPGDAAAPPWPGWPQAQVTAAVLCQAFFAPNAELKDPCARAYDPSAGARTYMEETLAECIPRVERSVLNARAEIAEPAAQTCVTKLLELRRSGRALVRGTEWEHACDGALVGKVAPGGSCRESWECREGACLGWSRTKAGKCTMPSNLNAPCTAIDLRIHPVHECVKDAYCAADTCKPVDKENETCGPDSCAEGTFCSSGLHKCVKALAVAGAKCLRHEDCAVGLFCDVDRCARQKPTGARCLDSIECQGDCERGACIARCAK